MAIKYSKSTGGWYNTSVSKGIPADAYDVPESLYEKCVINKPAGKVVLLDDSGMPYLSDPEQPSEELLSGIVRLKRNTLLGACDWTVLPDAPVSESKRSEWIEYRMALRDITEQPGFPASIVWPESP